MFDQSKPGSILLSDADISQMSLYALWCLDELYEQLSWTAMSFSNQPRVTGVAEHHADYLWDEVFNGTHQRIIEEMERRTPTTQEEAEYRAASVLRFMSKGCDYTEIAAFALGAGHFSRAPEEEVSFRHRAA